MSEPKSKMTLLLTRAERARLDALRLARGDRSAAATLRALVRDAGGDPPRAPAAPPPRRSENTLGLVDLAPGAVLPDSFTAYAETPTPAERARRTPEDAYAFRIIEEVRHAATDALAYELGHPLPPRPPPSSSAAESAASVAALIVQALPRWAGLDPGGDPPDPLRPAHVRGAARAARELADALEQLAERA